jgi:hypothetical protein
MCSTETKQFAAVRHMMKESMAKPNGITVGKAYKIATDYLDSEDEVIDLLTSEKCNYSLSEINYVKYQKEYKKQNQQLKASSVVSAF